MTLYFYEPPSKQKVGGLDLAIRSLRSYLLASGVAVESKAEFETLDDGEREGVVHFHGLWQPDYLKAARRCRADKLPYIVSPHGMLEPWAWKHKFWKKWPYFFLFERRFLLGAATLLATSEMEAASIRRFFPATHSHVIPLAMPELREPDYAVARRTLDWQPNENILLFLSRIHEKKGLHLLLEALARLDAACTKGLRLVIIGGGEDGYVKHVRNLAESLKLRLPRIDWLGEIWGEQKWVYLCGADLFCLPSFSENFGLAVLEAIQVGTRALTTDASPWEFLKEWDAGFIVKPNSDAVRQGLEEFFRRASWTEADRCNLAKRTKEKFGWETLGPEYLRLYQGLLLKT